MNRGAKQAVDREYVFRHSPVGTSVCVETATLLLLDTGTMSEADLVQTASSSPKKAWWSME